MYKKILLGIDINKNNQHYVLKAQKIAQDFHAELFLLHVIEIPNADYYAAALGFTNLGEPDIESAKIVLTTLAESLNIPNTNCILKEGHIAHSIIKAAKEKTIDLIVIGSHEKKPLANFLGSTANAVLQSATCDVLTLKKQ